MSSDEEFSSDSEPSETKRPVERVDTGSSGLYKMKKYFASKTVGTKAGRRVIRSMMGDEGDRLLEALKTAAAKFSSKSEAKNLKKGFLKMVLKGKLMFDEHRLTPANTSHAAQPINDLALMMVDMLEKTPAAAAEAAVDTEPLSQKFYQVRDLVVDLMKPHMQVKNTETLTHIFNFYGDPSFLRALLTDARFVDDRAAVKTNLTPIAQDIRKRADMFRSQPQKCYLNKCPKLRAPPRDDFAGSIYCPHHHLNTVMNDLDKPILTPFLNQTSQASQYFVRFLREHSEESKSDVDHTVLFRFNDALTQYRRLRHNLRKPRAELIYTKFISNPKVAAALGVSEATIKKVDDDLANVRMQLNASRARGTLHHLYDTALEESGKQLENLFSEFVKSNVFAEYRKAVTLPNDMLEEAKRRHTIIPEQQQQ